MVTLKSSSKKILYIDLTNKIGEIKVHSDLSDSLGGVGLGTLLLYDLIKRDPVIFSIGPFSGIYPCCSESCAVFISPLSKDWAESYCGGWMAAAVRFSALDAIVITGRSKRPVYLVIEDGSVEFKDASPLWGKGNFETYRILMEGEGVPGKRSVLTIGPAGEKQVAFASVLVDQFFSFQRLGLGALLGKKGVKGIVISGTQSEDINNLDLYNRMYQDILDQMMAPKDNEGFFSEYKTFGGLGELFRQNDIGGLPTRNLLATKPNNSASISGEVFRSKFPHKVLASFGCPIAFTHIAEFKGNKIPYDYENIAVLGPLLGIDNPEGILLLLSRALDLGLDPVSLGVVLAYLTELMGLEFADYEGYLSLIETLVLGKEAWAKSLVSGVRAASDKLGGEDFALHIAGVEMAPYFNGYATILGQLIGASHTIYDNEGFKTDLDLLGEEFEDTLLVESIINNEKRIIVLNSLVVSFFAREIYANPSLIFSALDSLGYAWSHEKLEKFSEELYYLKLRIKKALGFNLDKIKLPPRLFSIPSAYGLLKREKLNNMLYIYKEKVLS